MDLQSYILQYSVDAARHELQQAKKADLRHFNCAGFFADRCADHDLRAEMAFEPLIVARRQLFALAQLEDRLALESKFRHRQGSKIFDAISRLQKKLQEGEALSSS